MLVQTAPDGEPRFVMTMSDHLNLCAQFAQAIGNDAFAKIDSAGPSMFAIANHDRGWDEYDKTPLIDDVTGFPLIMAATPSRETVQINQRSPELVEGYHPFAGLLTSMHSTGLYEHRYGLSSFRLRAPLNIKRNQSEQDLVDIETLLTLERSRQARLKRRLLDNPSTANFATEAEIMLGYKYVQFADTLTLYFHLYHASDRVTEQFICVPKSLHEDVTVTLSKISDNQYKMDPYPFGADRVKVFCRGKYCKPLPLLCTPKQAGSILHRAATDIQTYEILPS